MKKILIALTLLAFCQAVSAQTRIVYIPGDGERQFGFTLIPSFCNQYLTFNVNNQPLATNSSDYTSAGQLNNSMGFGGGIFYGYETTHGRTLEWGNYSTLYYNFLPFSGKMSWLADGKTAEHQVNYNAQRVMLHENPFLTYRINDQFSVSAGLGFALGILLNSKVSIDGNSFQPQKSSDFGDGVSWFTSIFNFHIDANASVKYWFTDQWFCSARFQYCFYTLNFETFSSFSENGSNAKLDKKLAGNVKYDLNKGTVTPNYLIPRSMLQLALSIGYTW